VLLGNRSLSVGGDPGDGLAGLRAHRLELGQRFLGGRVGLRAQLGLLLGTPALLAGVALGRGLPALGLRDPYRGLPLDLIDL
jgi:hypothetical protein